MTSTTNCKREGDAYLDCVSDCDETPRREAGLAKQSNADSRCTCASNSSQQFDVHMILEVVTQINLLTERLFRHICSSDFSEMSSAETSQATSAESEDCESSERGPLEMPVAFDFPVQYKNAPCQQEEQQPQQPQPQQILLSPFPPTCADKTGRFPVYSNAQFIERGLFPKKIGPSDPRCQATQAVPGANFSDLRAANENSIQQQQTTSNNKQPVGSDDDADSIVTNEPIEDDCPQCPGGGMSMEDFDESTCRKEATTNTGLEDTNTGLEDINTEYEETCPEDETAGAPDDSGNAKAPRISYPTSYSRLVCAPESQPKPCEQGVFKEPCTTSNTQAQPGGAQGVCADKSMPTTSSAADQPKPCSNYAKYDEPASSSVCAQQTQQARSKKCQKQAHQQQAVRGVKGYPSATRRLPCRKRPVSKCSDEEEYFSALSEDPDAPVKKPSSVHFVRSQTNIISVDDAQGHTTTTQINRQEVFQTENLLQVLEYAINMVKSTAKAPPRSTQSSPCRQKIYSDVEVICPPRTLKCGMDGGSFENRINPAGDAMDTDPRPCTDISENISHQYEFSAVKEVSCEVTGSEMPALRENESSAIKEVSCEVQCSEMQDSSALRENEGEALGSEEQAYPEEGSAPCETSKVQNNAASTAQEPCNTPANLQFIPICQLPPLVTCPNAQLPGPCFIVCGVPPYQSTQATIEAARIGEANAKQQSITHVEDIEELENEHQGLTSGATDALDELIEWDDTNVPSKSKWGGAECEGGEVTVITNIDRECLLIGTEIDEIFDSGDRHEISYECTGTGGECKCCYCRALRNKKTACTTVATISDPCQGVQDKRCQDACYEMKNFVDSLLMNLEAMEQCRRFTPYQGLPDARVMMQTPEPIHKSFPVTINEVTELGKRSLFVKWTIHDCYGIGGYEIYTDCYLTNRYYHPGHESAVICDVDIKQPHKIVLVAKPLMDDGYEAELDRIMKRKAITNGCQTCCESSSDPLRTPASLWVPSVFFYDPSLRKRSSPERKCCLE